MPRTAAPFDQQTAPRIPLRGHALAVAVLAGLLVLTVLLWQAARDRELRSAEVEFAAAAQDAGDRLRDKLVQYELMTAGGVALFAAVDQPTPLQWSTYVQSLGLRARFPGLVGFGYAPFVPHSRLSDLQLAWRDAGQGLLNVRPSGVRPAYAPVLLLDPLTAENQQVIGYDMFSEPVRREAMERAMRTGRPQLTGPVQLLQDAGHEPAFLLYRAVYGPAPPGATTREAATQGFVYLPLRASTVVADALGPLRAQLSFDIADVTDGREVPLYRSSPQHGRGDSPPAFRIEQRSPLYGRTWRLRFDSPPESVVSPRIGDLENLLALGVLASLLMYLITLALVRTEARAHQLARRMTEDFQRSQGRFRVAMEHSATGLALLDSQGVIVQANPALGAIVGREPATLAGEPAGSLLLDAGAGAQDALPAPQDEVVRVTRRLRREGEMPRQVHITLAPVQGEVGEDIARLLQVEDVTERLRAEARVHALNRTLEARVDLRTRELQAANQELEAFAYSVSHDLRAPLRAIDGFSRMLQERSAGALDEAGLGYLRRVRESAGRMNGLIDALLAMTRLSRAELRPQTLDLSAIARDVVEDLRAADPGHQPRVAIADGLHAQGDAALVRNLLDNLLGNAWKFTRGRADARIDFDAGGVVDGMREFRIADNGAGFAQDYADKLFRPFQRLHSPGEFEGHGIGLASVRRIVERHAGTVRAQGVEGQGATFWFSLPVQQGLRDEG